MGNGSCDHIASKIIGLVVNSSRSVAALRFVSAVLSSQVLSISRFFAVL